MGKIEIDRVALHERGCSAAPQSGAPVITGSCLPWQA